MSFDQRQFVTQGKLFKCLALVFKLFEMKTKQFLPLNEKLLVYVFPSPVKIFLFFNNYKASQQLIMIQMLVLISPPLNIQTWADFI